LLIGLILIALKSAACSFRSGLGNKKGPERGPTRTA
jgi:hypothetical protein